MIGGKSVEFLLSYVNYRLRVNVAYVPDITPAPFSLLRNYAYGENTPLPGPEIDPEGWYALPTASIRGRLFSERMVKLRSSVSNFFLRHLTFYLLNMAI